MIFAAAITPQEVFVLGGITIFVFSSFSIMNTVFYLLLGVPTFILVVIGILLIRRVLILDLALKLSPPCDMNAPGPP